MRHANEYMDTPPPPETQPSQANTYSTNPSQQSSQQRAGDSQNKAVAVVAGAGGTVGKGPAAVPNAVPAAAPAPAAPPKRRRKSKAAGLVSPT